MLNLPTRPRIKRAHSIPHDIPVWGHSVKVEKGKLLAVKYWEIIADNLSKAGWSLGLRVSRGFQRKDNLDC